MILNISTLDIVNSMKSRFVKILYLLPLQSIPFFYLTTGFEEKPFLEFLKSKKLNKNLQHFIQYAIAMVNDTESTKESLQKAQKFLQSLGKYGNTAFLFPLYGTGELPQAFSR